MIQIIAVSRRRMILLVLGERLRAESAAARPRFRSQAGATLLKSLRELSWRSELDSLLPTARLNVSEISSDPDATWFRCSVSLFRVTVF